MKIIFFVFGFLMVLSCNRQNYHVQNNQSVKLESKEKNYAVIPFDAEKFYFLKFNKPAELTPEDIQKIDSLLEQIINEYNETVEKNIMELNNDKSRKFKINKNDHLLILKNYKRQYVSALNSDNEKIVWINCFCISQIPDWTKEIVFTLDGGNCYFNLKINLDTETYCDFRVNGIA